MFFECIGWMLLVFDTRSWRPISPIEGSRFSITNISVNSSSNRKGNSNCVRGLCRSDLYKKIAKSISLVQCMYLYGTGKLLKFTVGNGCQQPWRLIFRHCRCRWSKEPKQTNIYSSSDTSDGFVAGIQGPETRD